MSISLWIYAVSVILCWIFARIEMKKDGLVPDGRDIFVLLCPAINTLCALILLVSNINVGKIARIIFLIKEEE